MLNDSASMAPSFVENQIEQERNAGLLRGWEILKWDVGPTHGPIEIVNKDPDDELTAQLSARQYKLTD